MRDRMERFVVLPLTAAAGCVSQSSVDVVTTQPKKPKSSDHQSSPAAVVPTRRQEREESSSGKKMKNSWGFMALPKPKISSGIHRLVRSFKSLSQLFVYKEEMEEMEAVEMEMEIGFPTDVKHVTHIGWDGTATTNPVKGWENLAAQTEILSFPSISLREFELAMAAQTHNDGPPVCVTASKFT